MIDQYLDRHNLVKPHAAWSDASGDGVILSVVAGLLGVYNKERCNKAVLDCINQRSGCLMRRPTNENGPQSHDGWMALAVWLQFTNNAVMARGLLMSALFKGFYMKHRPFEFEGKTWTERLEERLKPAMCRFPKIWIAMTAAAYPNAFVKSLCSLILRALTSISSVRPWDASGVQLGFLDRFSIMMMGNKSPMVSYLKQLRSLGYPIASAMSNFKDPFFDPDHVVISGYRNFEQEMLT